MKRKIILLTLFIFTALLILFSIYSIFKPDRETRKYIFLTLSVIATIFISLMYIFPDLFSMSFIIATLLSLVCNIGFLLTIDILSYVYKIEIFSSIDEHEKNL